MKRFLCTLLVLCLIPVCVSAVDLSDFNMYAYIFGEDEIDLSAGRTSKAFTIYESNGCTIAFKEEDGEIKTIVVEGDGLPFVSYAMAAIMFFAPDSSDFVLNSGRFLSQFLMFRRKQETEMGTLSTGANFQITTSDKGALFMVMR